MPRIILILDLPSNPGCRGWKSCTARLVNDATKILSSHLLSIIIYNDLYIRGSLPLGENQDILN
jgi:hypothetical protein